LNFLSLAKASGAHKSAIAVDPSPKIPGYDLLKTVSMALDNAVLTLERQSQNDCSTLGTVNCELIPVSPWGNFVPALNALVSWGCSTILGKEGLIMFLSVETNVTPQSINKLCQYVNLDDTLVVGAALRGHDHKHSSGSAEIEVELNGVTTPWNTLAVWNLKKLAITGFAMIAEVVYSLNDGRMLSPGVEELSTIILQQNICVPPETAKAKLVRVSGVNWDQDFDDEERKKWHELKMKSKVTRAALHKEAMGGMNGTVTHY